MFCKKCEKEVAESEQTCDHCIDSANGKAKTDSKSKWFLILITVTSVFLQLSLIVFNFVSNLELIRSAFVLYIRFWINLLSILLNIFA